MPKDDSCEVSGLKNPAPSPRIRSTVRPDSSTTVAVITVPSCFAWAKAAYTARSKMSSVSSIIIGPTLYLKARSCSMARRVFEDKMRV